MKTELILDQAPRPKDSIIIAKTVQDVEPILENNAMLRTQQQRSDWGRHIAEIPNVIITRWLNEEHARGNVGIKLFGHEFNELVARKLKDPDWAYLRVDSKENGILGFGS
jgi:hypothetical protein